MARLLRPDPEYSGRDYGGRRRARMGEEENGRSKSATLNTEFSDCQNNFLTIQIISVRIKLIIIIVVIGKYNLKLSFSIRMSPGRCPNHESLSPASQKTRAARMSSTPMTISIFERWGMKQR